MHVHRLPINLNQADLHSTQAAERAAAAQRALETRNALLEKSLRIEEPADTFEQVISGRELDKNAQRRRQNVNAARHTAVPQADGSDGSENSEDDEPMSFWA